MSYDPNDPRGPHWRSMMEIAETARRFGDISESSAMRALRESQLPETYRLGPDAMAAFTTTKQMVVGMPTLTGLVPHLSAGVSSVLQDAAWRDTSSAFALRSLADDLTRNGVLERANREALRIAGVIPARDDLLRTVAPAAASLSSFAAPMTAISDALNSQLRVLGVDYLAGAMLATGGIASRIARVDAHLRDIIAPQWQALGGLSATVNRLWAVTEIQDRILGLPGYLRLAPTIEPYASARSLLLFVPADIGIEEPLILDLIAEGILEEVDAEFEARLASVDQGLVRPVRGAWQAAQSERDDRVRHAAISVRHVIETLIAALAPQDVAAAWLKTKGFGKRSAVPGRAKGARSAKKWAPQLRYIMRLADECVGGDSLLSAVAEVDLADMLLLLERLNQAVHEGDAEIAEEELAFVLRRATAFMTLLLDAHEMGKA